MPRPQDGPSAPADGNALPERAEQTRTESSAATGHCHNIQKNERKQL